MNDEFKLGSVRQGNGLHTLVQAGIVFILVKGQAELQWAERAGNLHPQRKTTGSSIKTSSADGRTGGVHAGCAAAEQQAMKDAAACYWVEQQLKKAINSSESTIFYLYCDYFHLAWISFFTP